MNGSSLGYFAGGLNMGLIYLILNFQGIERIQGKELPIALQHPTCG
jgi:hypothetical protein